jgi:predicted Rossmann fold nucleotide-binding protein DprA/Smf involved in DNA uptake
MPLFTLGNKDILTHRKTAFLCSRAYPSTVVAKAYEWAIEQREKGMCVISGFHSQIEKDVFHFLLKGTQPVILALARGIPKRLDAKIETEIGKERLLLLSRFPEKIKRASEKTAHARNEMMINMADEIVVGYASEGGNIGCLLRQVGKPVKLLLQTA